MRIVTLLLCFLMPFSANAEDKTELSPTQLQARVVEINSAQNKVMMRDSTVEDADSLFALYTDDFTYIHEIYGGTYTKDELYGNTVKHLKKGGYTLDEDRYAIVRMIPGRNAVAVERRENSGAIHLSVFEFEGAKVSRIVEYWK